MFKNPSFNIDCIVVTIARYHRRKRKKIDVKTKAEGYPQKVALRPFGTASFLFFLL